MVSNFKRHGMNKEKIILWWKIYFRPEPISYGKFYEFFNKIVNKYGFSKKDLCTYRLTQVYDHENRPTDEFYYSNKSLGANTTYKQTYMKEFMSSYNLEFAGRDKNNGLFTKNSKTKVFWFLGRNKLIINSPYMVHIKFGDFIAISNDLLMVIPIKEFKQLFK